VSEQNESTALAVIEGEYELRIGDVHVAGHQEVLTKAAEVSRELAGIIKSRQLSKRIGQKEFVMVEGWTTCGAMFGVAIRPVSCDENPTCEGEFVATVEAVRTGDGFVLGRGFASCGMDEPDWKRRSRQARRSMAQTRAAGKAMRLLFSWVMEMAGYAPTPFEEMEGCQVDEQPNPEPAPNAPREQTRAKRQAPVTDVSQQQLGHVTAHWRATHPDPNGDAAAQRAKFYTWAKAICKRDFDPSKLVAWKLSDYEACCRAMNVETLEDLA
jgi:hypothetical protein